ncbi:MAG: Asp-tRNA(Asn)/Glu-tRNA(Gln) amidotransferase subunit GatC [Spirochaetia bacterium]|nr:Asp-tRNA(Asn)/Glu-tRNA(Gln) amidotransferase subunit GatC [Spirochaetia bacterium]
MISENEFKELALLARLDPDDRDLAGLRDDFNKILDFVEKIKEVNLSSAGEIRTMNENLNIMRPDKPGELLDTHEISSFAPEWEAGHFVVPGAIDSEG